MRNLARVSWVLTLGLTASGLALVAAPQALLFAGALVRALPTWILATPATAALAVTGAYEAALWTCGLGTALVGARLGWIQGRSSVFIVAVSPVLSEIVLLRLLGIAAPLSLLGLTLRLLFAAAAVVVVRLFYPRGRPPG